MEWQEVAWCYHTILFLPGESHWHGQVQKRSLGLLERWDEPEIEVPWYNVHVKNRNFVVLLTNFCTSSRDISCKPWTIAGSIFANNHISCPWTPLLLAERYFIAWYFELEFQNVELNPTPQIKDPTILIWYLYLTSLSWKLSNQNQSTSTFQDVISWNKSNQKAIVRHFSNSSILWFEDTRYG